MNELLQRRLLFILHRGLVEARLLAQAKRDEQIFDLADALEPIPSYMAHWHESDLESVKFNLKTYSTKHPSSSFEYMRYLDDDFGVPDF